MRNIVIFILFVHIAACASPVPGKPDSNAASQAVDKDAVQVMILGSWHMRGSTSDVANVKTD